MLGRQGSTPFAFALALLVALPLVACGPAEEPATDEEASPTLADFAGTWRYTADVEGAEDPVELAVVGSAESDEWRMELQDRPPVPLQVSVEGDSLISESAEYESILRAGVMVTVRTAGALQDGRMTGTLLARYQTEDGEETRSGTFQAVRTQ